MSVTGLWTEVTSLDLHKRPGGSRKCAYGVQSIDFIENSHIGCSIQCTNDFGLALAKSRENKEGKRQSNFLADFCIGSKRVRSSVPTLLMRRRVSMSRIHHIMRSC
jgi:hypothetical protein